jgi:hypothetical protein
MTKEKKMENSRKMIGYLLVFLFVGFAIAAGPAYSGQTILKTGYYAVENGSLDQWTFYPDGSFLHEGAIPGAGIARSERGAYVISHGYIELHINKSSSSVSAPGTRTISGVHAAFQDKKSQVRRMKIQLLGRNGEDGIVLGNERLKAKHGW